MAQRFAPGDLLVFQLESGFGLLRVIAVDETDVHAPVWHLLAHEELFPSVEQAEAAVHERPDSLGVRAEHLALTNRAFERTPAARIGNLPLSETELIGYRKWLAGPKREVSDRSALLMLGLR